MSTAGIRDTSNVAGRKYDVADVVSLLDVGRYPLLGILTNAGKDPATKQGKAMKKKETSDPEFKWFEDVFGSRTATTTTSQTGKDIAGAFDVVLATGQGARFVVGDVVKFVGSGNTFLVTAISTDTLSLSAELGGATGTLDLSSLEVWIVGNANEEGAGLRAIKGTTAVEKTGYCQIFRTPFGVTETSKNTKTFIRENDLDYQRRKKGIEHMVDIERAFLFGKKSKITSGTHPRRFTEGVFNVISSFATANVDTEAEFEAFLEDAFKHGNTEKYAFCGAAFVSQINIWAKNKLQIMQGEKTYGLTILRYVSPHGTLNIIKHDLLTGTKYGNYCVVLDMEALTYRYLSTRDTKLATNRQDPGQDEVVEEYLSEVGLQMEQEERHAIASKAAL
jgi:hypothetical protein